MALLKGSAFDGGEDVSTGRVLNRQDGRATRAVHESTRDLPLGLGMEVGGGVSLAMCTGREGCRTVSQLVYLEATCSAGDASGMSVMPAILVTAAAAMMGGLPSSLGRSNPQKTSSSWNTR